MKECELCNFPARMYCESDQASLCWDCDAKVHCANFLVARHSRTLLCQICQSPTPWKASGSTLGRTISVCARCVSSCGKREEVGVLQESEGGNEIDDNIDEEDNIDVDEDDDEDGEDENDSDLNDDDDGDEDDDDDDEDDDDSEQGENQVVPWSSTPPPPVASSSSSEESAIRFFSGEGGVSRPAIASSLKRMRENADLVTEDDLASSSSQPNYNADLAARSSENEEATSFGDFRPLKDRRRTIATRSGHVQPHGHDKIESKSTALVGSLMRLQQDMISGDDASATIIGICKLSEDRAAVDLMTNGSPSRKI